MPRSVARVARVSAPSRPVAVGAQVRRLRSRLRISLRELADRSGFSPSFISQVEKGLASPSLSSLEKLANVLGVALRDFFTAPEDAHALIVRRGERRHATSSWSKARLESLGAAGQKLAAMMIVLAPQGRSGKHPRAQPREEFASVAAGEVLLTLGEEEHALRSGDSVIIPAGLPRLWVNASRKRAQVLIVSAL